jgi:hypothetical protein
MNTLEYLNQNYSTQLTTVSVGQLTQEFYKIYIKCVYNIDANGTSTFLFNHHRTNALINASKVQRVIMRECHGLVMEQTNGKWSLLCKQTDSLCPTVVDRASANFLLMNDKYDIYRVREGSVITLYWNKSWLMASNTSINIGPLDLDGIQFGVAFAESLKRTSEMDIEELHKLLDQSHSYTFGFKHSAMHPFQIDKQPFDFWFIQSYDTVSHKTSRVSPDPRIDIQQTIKLDYKTQNFATLNKELSDAYLDFAKYGNVLLGYIIRHKDNLSESEPDFLLESSLQEKIRTLYYDAQFRRNAEEIGCGRKDYVSVSGYVHNKDLFLLLFPQFTTEFKSYDAIVDKLSKKIISIASGSCKNVDSGEDAVIFPYAAKLYAIISIKMTIKSDAQTVRFLNDYILTNISVLINLKNQLAKSQTQN